MPRTLVTSPSAEVRLRFARTVLEEWRDRSVVHVIAPTRGAGDDLVRSLDLSRGRGGLYRSTLLQFALDRAAVGLSDLGLAPVGGIATQALTIQAIRQTRAQGDLEYFDQVADTVGFASALQKTISELRLEDPRQALDPSSPAGRDLARLVSSFESELALGKLADPADIYRIAADILSRSGDPLAGDAALLFDLRPDNRAEARFIEALANASKDIVAITLPSAERALGHLAGALDRAPLPLDEPRPGRTLDRIRSFVFVAETPDPGSSDGSLTFFSATDEGRECVEIARHIHRASAEGTRFDDIAILLRDPGTYQPLVEEALSRAEIPAYYTRATRRPNPSGRAFLALLACRSDGLSASRFAEYLSLGQIPTSEGEAPNDPRWVPSQGELFPDAHDEGDSDGEGRLQNDTDPNGRAVIEGSLTTPDRWNELLVDAAVIAGRDRWERRLNGLRQELGDQVREVVDDDARREYLERQIARLDRLRTFALPLIRLLDSLPSEATWGEWLPGLEGLAVAALRNPDPVLSALGELRPMGPIGPATLDDIEQVLGERLSFLRTEPSPGRYGRVFVSGIRDVAGRAFRIVFVPGLSEGLFPRKPASDPLLPDTVRARTDAGLRVNADRIEAERELLHLSIGSARDRLFVSYPRMDLGQGRARVPSFYALDVLRAAEGSIPELGELEQRAVSSSRSRLGWPGPVHPREAIDAAEYDLATIGGLLHQPPARVGGRAHYLVGSHAILARSLRSRARRWKNFWCGADGLVDPEPETVALLASYGLKHRAYSPTALEQMAACPYRFFLRAVHRLHPRREIDRLEQLDPLTRGRLFHTVQFRLLSSLAGRLLPVSTENVDAARKELERVLAETAAEFHERLAPAIERVWESEIEDLGADLRGWLLRMAAANGATPDWIPRHFEFAFGLGGRDQDRDPDSRTEEAQLPDGFRLRGAVDLIEENRRTGLLRVVDHKTGRRPSTTPRQTGSGETLQPLLYALAVEVLFEAEVAVSELSFCTEKGEFRTIEIRVDSDAKAQTAATLAGIDDLIRSGFFPAAPRAGACQNCDYRVVCGPYEELRANRKLRAPLEGLERIRQIP